MAVGEYRMRGIWLPTPRQESIKFRHHLPRVQNRLFQSRICPFFFHSIPPFRCNEYVNTYYDPIDTRPIPYPAFKTECIPVTPSYFYPSSRLKNFSYPKFRLDFKPHPASRQTNVGLSLLWVPLCKSSSFAMSSRGRLYLQLYLILSFTLMEKL